MQATTSIRSGESDKQIMQNIESKATAKVEQAYRTGQIINNSDSQNMTFAQNIIACGSDEFVKKVGRHPTYSELREMFG